MLAGSDLLYDWFAHQLKLKTVTLPTFAFPLFTVRIVAEAGEAIKGFLAAFLALQAAAICYGHNMKCKRRSQLKYTYRAITVNPR